MQVCRKLGSLLLVLVFVVSILTAVPVLGADEYESITLDQTQTGMTIRDTGTAVVNGVAEDGSITQIESGVTYSVTKTGSQEVITVDSDGKITAECEGTAILTATYGDLKASVMIVVGVKEKSKAFDDASEGTYNVSWPRGGVTNTAEMNFTDTTEIDTTIKRSGTGSLHLKEIDLETQKTVSGQSLTEEQKTELINSYWARTNLWDAIDKAENGPLRGVSEVWYYDSGENRGSIWIIGGGAQATGFRGRLDLNTSYSFKPDNPQMAPPTVNATIPRSKGWHQIVLDYSTDDTYTLYIDGQTVYSVTEAGRVGGLPAFQSDRNIKNENEEIWVDDWSVYDVTLTKAVAPVVSNVTISGKTMEEQTLTASYTYSDANGDLETGQTYVWEKSANGTDGWTQIGTNSDKYTLTAEDVGSYIRVGVTATNDAEENHTSEQVYSEAVGPVEVKPDLESQNFTKVDISHTKNVYVIKEGESEKDTPGKVTITGISDNGEYDLEGYEKVSYSIDDPYTATVSEDGTITPVGVGYAILTATVENADGSKTSGKLFITVGSAKSSSDFENFTKDESDTVNTHVEVCEDFARTGTKAIKYQKPPENATEWKWGLDQYASYNNGYVIGEGWFYDNGSKGSDGYAAIYYQSLTVREERPPEEGGRHEYPFILNMHAGILSPENNYYQIQNNPGGRGNRGPGEKVDYTGTDQAGKGYLGDNTGTFVTDGTNGMPLIERSVGWHQITLIAQLDDGDKNNIATENGKLTLYIDGIKAFEENYAVDGIGCVRGNGATSPNYAIYDDLSVVQAADSARPPLVTNIELTGTAMEERSMTVSAESMDKNGDELEPNTYQWQVYNEEADPEPAWENIDEATSDTYTFTSSDIGKQFRVAVTPHSTVEPYDGTVAYSDVIGPVVEKKTKPWIEEGSYSISGEPKIGHTLTAVFTFASDPVTGGGEGESIVNWQRADEENGTYTTVGTGLTYNPTAADAGKYLRAEIIPVDEYGLQGPAVTTASVQVSTEVNYYVATDGSDDNAGSLDAPFATITKARDVIRQAIQQGLSEGSIVVNIRGGEYPVSSTIAFTEADSGTEDCPITYRAYNGEKVTFSGGTVISADKISKLTESDKDIYGNKILDRIQDPVAKSKVVKIDLSDYEGDIPVLSEGWSYSWETSWPKNTIPVDVYVNGSVIEPARWPNNEEDTAMFNPVSVDSEKTESGAHDNSKPVTITYPDPDNETANWNQQAIEDDLMIAGYFGYHWYMNDHKVGEMDTENKVLKTLGGTAVAPATNLAYYLYNIIEAIDAPGEGYIDRENKIAYFYPDSELDETAEIRIAGNNQVLLSMNGTKYVNFEGLDFEYNRTKAVSLTNVDHITWDNCDVAHTGDNSMSASGTNITIKNSHIYDSGKNGLTISGGDRKTLTPSNNLITNNIFHDHGRAQKTYVPAIQISDCVGATISHNEIFNNNHEAIAYANSNDIIIEYNDLHHVVTTSGDMGAIYCGRNVTEMGYVIRYNKFAHIGSKYSEGWSQSIFFDDGNSGAEIYGNIFYRGTLTMDKGATTGRSFAVKTNGGQFFDVHDNIFIDMPSALQFQSWSNRSAVGAQERYISYNNDVVINGDFTIAAGTANQRSDFTSVGFQDGIWAEHYEGTIWEPIFDLFTDEVYNTLQGYLQSGNGLAARDYVDTIAPKQTNNFYDNVAVQIANEHITVQSNNENLGTNYVNADITTSGGDPLFVDYDNEDFQLTAEGLAEVRQTITGFENIDTSKIGPQTSVDGSRPVASNVALSGDNVPGGKARVTYTYSDADNQKEVGTTYQWYAAETPDGDYELIRGEFSTELTIPNSVAGKYIKCVVTPSDERLIPGQAVATEPVQVVADLADVDKSELRSTIAEANELLSSAVVGNEDGQYPQDAVDTFQALVDEAQAVANNPNALQFQVDAETEKLKAGIESFKGKVITSMELMSIKGMLADAENWQTYVGGEFTIENGVLTLPTGTGAAYTGEEYKNKIFVFKMKIDPAGETEPTVINSSINFRAQEPAVLWSSVNMGYLWWIKPDINEAQFFQPNILKEFDTGLIEIGKEYTVGVGVYDTAGEAVRMRLYLDDFTTPVYEYDFTKEETGGDNLYGQSGYFMAASGNEVITTISAVEDADKSELQEVLAAAKALRAAAVQGDAYGEYSRTMIDQFDAAIAKADEINNDTNAVQITVDSAVSSLESAMTLFKASANTDVNVTVNGEATINYDLDSAKFTVNPGVTSFVLNLDASKQQPMYQFIYKASAGDVTVDIARGATFSASGWDGTFDLPIVGDTPSGTINGENCVVITMGESGKVINSTELARIVMPGQGGRLLAYKTEDGSYKTIGKNTNLSEDTMAAAEAALPDGGVAKLTVGNDLVIYTSMLTEFVAYDFKATSPTPSPTPTDPSNPSGPSGPSTPGNSITSPGGPSTTTPTPTPGYVQYRFTDIVGHWAGLDINDMADRGIVSGVTATTFEPDREITRAEFAALMVRALELTAQGGSNTFADVDAGSWYAPEVAAAANAGLIVGYDGYFRPDENITREEMAVVIMKGYAYLQKEITTGKLDQFADKDEISDWARDYVDQAVSVGLISGMTTDTFAPKSNATRAQVASLIKRMLDN